VSNPGCLGHWGSGHDTMTTAATVRAAKVIGGAARGQCSR
jgi:hypothetical protein